MSVEARAGLGRGFVTPIASERMRGQAWWLAKALALAAICALPILLYLPFLSEPFERDEGAYATIARGLLQGELPFRDYIDHKPPLIYVY